MHFRDSHRFGGWRLVCFHDDRFVFHLKDIRCIRTLRRKCLVNDRESAMPDFCPYEGGEYWGQLLFPSDYPFKPPGIKMTTPSGRFKENEKICTS